MKRIMSFLGPFLAAVLLAGCYGSPEKAEKLEILLAAEGPAPAKPDAATENDEGARQWGLGRPAVAEEHFRKAAEMDTKFATAHFNLGVALDALGRHHDAARAFKQAALLASDVPKITESEILKRHKGM